MRRAFAAAAGSYDAAAVLAREVGARMAERLDYINLTPRRLADIGCATGDGVRELQRRYGDALPLAIDYAWPMLSEVRRRSGRLQRLTRRAPRLLNADVRALPLADASLDLVWSNLMLHWLPDPFPAFRELHRVLAVGGLLMFACLGPDTLRELRSICHELGIASPLAAFPDMHDLGDQLLAAGFADPVMDMELLTLTYATPRQFLADQRHLGVADALLGVMPWREWRRVFAAWDAQRQDGRLPATFEIVYGHAWKVAPRQASTGQAVIQVHRPPR